MNAFDRADELVRNLGLPGFHREAIRAFAKQVVLDAAKVCEQRASANPVKIQTALNEARKCAGQIRHNLLCRGTQSICLHCDGEGCEKCDGGFLPTGGYQPKS